MIDFDEKAKEMAREHGAKTANRSPVTWNGKPIFVPVWEIPEGEERISGLPQYIILDGEKLRWTWGDECLDVHTLVVCSRNKEAFLIHQLAEIEAKIAELE